MGNSSGEINTLSREEEFDNMVSKLGGRAMRPKTRNYYPRPLFVDVQFKERSSFVENSYSGESIVEWNIDDASKKQVLDTIQNMTMAVTTFKLKGNTDKHTKDILVVGFFVGEPLKLQQRAANQLLNLYCPTMSDYRWYRDMFLSKLCLRSDGAADYWKERFINGLPILFVEKSKNENMSNRREMGSFCKQYGATPLRAPGNPKNKRVVIKSKKNFRYHKKQPYKDNSEFHKAPYKKNYGKKPYRKPYDKTKPKDKDVKCYKYGCFGHYANKCKMQGKINQLGNLDISEELKESLISIFKNILLNSEEEDNSSSYEESSYEEIRQINNSEESNSDSDEYLGIDFCNCNSCNKSINILTNHQANTLIGILDKMEESESKNAFMRQIKKIIDKNDICKKHVNKVEFKDVMNLF
ncbi:uncharacterized protein LOC127104936 [Lathyrus oleraceus]|uniref:uncharacterized protein LOC127104936 n=1 Tax=Pisum sativum TaxID=3888 RepID=UPI0021CE541F|nr:uncharacterized protein LOC127104936 [Pisum sativum]